MFKVNNKNTRGPEGRQWRRSRIFIVNFEHVSHLFLLAFADIEQVIVSRVTN